MLSSPRRQGQRAAIRHGVARVDRGIEDRGLQLRNVDFHSTDLRRQLELHAGCCLPSVRSRPPLGIEPKVEVEHFRLDRLAAPEGQK